MLRKIVALLLGVMVFCASCNGSYLNKSGGETKISPEIKRALDKRIPSFKVSNEMDIRVFLSNLAKEGNLNIICAERIKGKVSIFTTEELKNVTLGELLESVLILNNLAMDIKGNIITIMSAAQFQDIYDRNYDDKRCPKMIKLKYVKPSAILNFIMDMAIGRKITVIVDDDTMNIYIKAFPDKLKEIELIIKKMDVPENKEEE